MRQGDCDSFTQSIAAALSPAYKNMLLLHYPQLDSTNNQAKRLLPSIKAEQFLVTAQQQSSGRGRKGRNYFSPPGNVYMTLAQRIPAVSDGTVSITTMASVAVVRAIARLSNLQTQIKWVNDVYYEGKKICGILCELLTDLQNTNAYWLIIGIGINIGHNDFPAELADIATSLPNDQLSAPTLIAEILNQLLALITQPENKAYLNDYRKHSLVLGKAICYWKNGRPYSGIAIDIDEQAALLVQHTDGTIHRLDSGEISIRLENRCSPKQT